MRKIIEFLFISICFENLHAQKIFQKVDLGKNVGVISGVAQDSQGFIWLTTESLAGGGGAGNDGLLKYDGSKVIAYLHNDKDPKSITNAKLETLSIDDAGNIWIGSLGGGMDKFDPDSKTFSHFRHDKNKPGSLSNDTVTAILQDHLGNLWVGTSAGLDRYDSKSGIFIHYIHNTNDRHSLSGTHVRVLYEDREGNLWIGCGSPFPNEESWKGEGGLNLLNRKTGKFTCYLHDPNDSSSIASNKVRALLEDSKGNFWVGTAGDGLQTLNRQTGRFTHYYYDSTHPEKLSRGPLYEGMPYDQVTFIKEDTQGRIWIGTFAEGIVEYNPSTKKVTHYGRIVQPGKTIKADTLAGFDDIEAWRSLISKDGLLWIATITGNLYKVGRDENIILPYNHAVDGNNFYKSDNETVWIGTDSGLIRKDEKTGSQKRYLNNHNNPHSLSSNNVYDIKAVSAGRLWIGTFGGGLDNFDLETGQFRHYNQDSRHILTGTDSIFSLYPDAHGYLWIATINKGIIKLDTATGKTSQLRHDVNDSNSLASNATFCVEGHEEDVWVGTSLGLDKIEPMSRKFYHYLSSIPVFGVLIDKQGIVWAGTPEGLFKYEQVSNNFKPFKIAGIKIGKVISLNADKNNNIWISSANSIVELKSDRQHITIYDADNGVHSNRWTQNNDYISTDGEAFIGDPGGYYHFYVDSVQQKVYEPKIQFESLQIGGKNVTSAVGSILNKPLYKSQEIKIPNKKSSFSITFSVIDFRTPGEKKVVYILENYDNQWHETNEDHTAYFYNLPIGHYVLRARAINAHGAWSEKTLSIIITPPWWQTWWGISILVVTLVAIILGFSYYRSYSLRKENKILEEKVKHRTSQLQKSLEDLKSTQTQLIQQEKMASLGELTAGIAHEIQNPLNFVNNFSEVNKEMLEELNTEHSKPRADRDEGLERAIIKDLIVNEEKIIYHGKRADAIVKNMLQHSRATSGKKEPTNINALCDEYLRLSYHGLRAKDKSFNAGIETDFDDSIGKINIVSQDIGRVLLNLFNNAFYAVTKRQQEEGKEFKPTVSVKTQKSENSVIITVSDNGGGIPDSIKQKIFQPFFTTKPTGQGTGLGLSLSYDIVKAHGGEIKMESKEGEARPNDTVGRGTTFILQLPITA